MKPAVFFDRDGTLNEEVGYITDPVRLRLLPGAAEAVKRVREAGWLSVVITNQGGVGRGLMTEADVGRVNGRLADLLAAEGASVDAIYYCPHHPEGAVEAYRKVCDCRKPAPGLVLRAGAEMKIDLARSVMIGDKVSDIGLAAAAGVKPVLVMTGFGPNELPKVGPAGFTLSYLARDVLAAVQWALTPPKETK